MNPYKAFFFFFSANSLARTINLSCFLSDTTYYICLPATVSFCHTALWQSVPNHRINISNHRKLLSPPLLSPSNPKSYQNVCLPLMSFPMLLKGLLLLPMSLPILQLMNHFSFSTRWNDREDTRLIFDPWIECTLLNRSWALKAKPQSPWAERRHRGHKMVNWKEDSVVFVGQSSGNTRQQLLPGSVHVRGAFSARVSSQNNDNHIAQELLGERQNDN